MQIMFLQFYSIFRYVEYTGDIQSASILLAMGNCFRKSKILQDVSMVGIKVSDLLARAMYHINITDLIYLHRIVRKYLSEISAMPSRIKVLAGKAFIYIATISK